MIRALALVLLLVAAPAHARTLDARWTDAAERAYAQRVAKGATASQLPEVRAFDGAGRPILRMVPAGPALIGTLMRAIRAGRPLPAGETLDQTLGWLELRGGGAVRPAVGNPRVVVVDYWAEWCAPCKAVSAELDRWSARQPPGSVTLIRAETDLIAAQRLKPAQ